MLALVVSRTAPAQVVDGGDNLTTEYRRRAAEAERRTESAISEEERWLILEVARIWHTMANQRELLLSGSGFIPPPSR